MATSSIRVLTFCGFLALQFWACSSQPELLSRQDISTMLTASPSLKAEQLELFAKQPKWSYKNNNFTIENINSSEHPVIQLYSQHCFVAQDPKSNIPTATDPLGELLTNAELRKKAKVTINGKSYSGTIEIIAANQTEAVTLFEMELISGTIINTISAVDKSGKIYTAKGSVVLDINNSVRKPVIYLYPQTTQNVQVQVDFKGKLSHTYPKYNPQTGWKVTAKPDGTLRDLATSKVYYNLFWEGQSTHNYTVNQGFVVEGSRTAEFLDEALAQLGLNRREANEFITYWLPELEKNPYNLIHFAQAEYTHQAPLRVQPQPDTQIRVFMVYSPLDAPINIPAQTLQTPQRQGFTLVEWGGKMQTYLPQ